jgi:glycosyltransferase involved in cell wall biosynthesis
LGIKKRTNKSSTVYLTKLLIRNKEMQVVHITTVHQRTDARIFYKECLSLKEAGHSVSLIVADGKGDSEEEGIKIYDIGLYNNRLKRLLFSSKKAIKRAKSLNVDVYHFHDPDLLIAIRKLKKKTNHVIFDSHEDFPILMYQRPYIPKPFQHIFFLFARHIEKTTAKKIDAVVCATDKIRDKFLSYGIKSVITVKNYPIINIDEKEIKDKKDIPQRACYVGGLTKIRGVKEMINACQKASVPLTLVGPFDDKEYFNEMKNLEGWKNVEYLGVLPHKELEEKVYNKATIGLNLLLDAPNHRDAIPIKQLEYMASCLAVVTSCYIDFCVEVTKETHCGIVVKPEDSDEVAKALTFLCSNKQEASLMGKQGQRAVKDKYNWIKEKPKLISLYSSF